MQSHSNTRVVPFADLQVGDRVLAERKALMGADLQNGTVRTVNHDLGMVQLSTGRLLFADDGYTIRRYQEG